MIESDLISYEDFEKVKICVGKILEANEFPQAKKPAYKLAIDFGSEIGVKKSSAQITDLYTPETLIGKYVLAVVNFPPRQIGPFISSINSWFSNDQTRQCESGYFGWRLINTSISRT